jgi:hypothetical protein
MITDMTGCEALTGTIAGNSGSIDVSRLAPGNYILKVMDEDNVGRCMKFIKN